MPKNEPTLPEAAKILKQQVLDWLQTMKDANSPVWEYRMNCGASATVFTSCFAVFVRHH